MSVLYEQQQQQQQQRQRLSKISREEEVDAKEDQSSVGSLDSREEALCELLGLTSLSCHGEEDCDEKDASGQDPRSAGGTSASHAAKNEDGWWKHRSEESIRQSIVGSEDWMEHYNLHGYARFDASLRLPAAHLRIITEQLVWGNDKDPSTSDPHLRQRIQRTYETIATTSDKGPSNKRCLTRLECFCDVPAWKDVADYVGRCLSVALRQPMILYKEKLNLKPSGGSGFAPHLDTPSLRQLDHTIGMPSDFVTVLVAIDDMNARNGCLRIAPGPWNEDTAVVTETAGGTNNNDDDVDNPDGGGRRGLIPSEIAESLEFLDLPCVGGDMIAFSGWTPHRSGCNQSHFSRRAVFFTYHPRSDGDLREAYYQRMQHLRDQYRQKQSAARSYSAAGLSPELDDDCDALAEWQALQSVPRI